MNTTVERLKAAVQVINGVIAEMETQPVEPPPVVVPPPVVIPPPVTPPVDLGSFSRVYEWFDEVPAVVGNPVRHMIRNGDLNGVVILGFRAPPDANLRTYYVQVPEPRGTFASISTVRGDFSSAAVIAATTRPKANVSYEMTTKSDGVGVRLVAGQTYYLNTRFLPEAGKTFTYEWWLERMN